MKLGRTLFVVLLAAGALFAVQGPSEAVGAGPTVQVFPVPGGTYGLAAGPDGAVWFAEFLEHRIGRIDTSSNAVTEFTLPSGGEPRAMAAGPDGNLWFTIDFPTGLGRITPSGVITEFPISGACCGRAIVATATHVWFTLGSGLIGRSDTSGAMTFFPVASGLDRYGDLALGPDGNLWYGTDNKTIGRMTPAGVSTEFAVPEIASSLASGPDGNIWFDMEANPPGVQRMTTAGMLLAPVPADVSGVATGPDGAVWFHGFGEVGRLNIPGAHFRAPWYIFDMAAGPDGNMWFSNAGANQVGRVRLPGATRTELSTSARAVDEGSPVTFTATVTAPLVSSAPTGTVQFYDGSNQAPSRSPLGDPVPVVGGVASITVTLNEYDHLVTADYAADGPFFDSASGVLDQRVRAKLVINALPGLIHGKPDNSVLTLTATLDDPGGSSVIRPAAVLMTDSKGQRLCVAFNSVGLQSRYAACSLLLDPLAVVRLIAGGGYRATVVETDTFATVSDDGVLLGLGGL